MKASEMPAGHLGELRRRVGRINDDDVSTVARAGATWGSTAAALADVRMGLEKAAPEMIAGFGDSEVGQAGARAFRRAAAKIRAREDELRLVAERLTEASIKLDAAHRVDKGAPEQPDPIGPYRPGYGEPDDGPGPMLAHAARVAQQRAQAKQYEQAEQQAQVRVEELKIAYADTTAAMALIEGEPDRETRRPGRDDERGGRDAGLTGGAVPSIAAGGSAAAVVAGARALLTRSSGAPTPARSAAGARPGTLAPGTPVQRGGGATGRRTNAGAAGSRAALAGRGRRGSTDPETPGERDLFDDGSDWIDDVGAGPAVLGRADATHGNDR